MMQSFPNFMGPLFCLGEQFSMAKKVILFGHGLPPRPAVLVC
jgi:hypothetical protein